MLGDLFICSEWTETFPYDFRDERMMTHLKKITQRCIQIDSRLRKEVAQLIQNLLHKVGLNSQISKSQKIQASINSFLQ